MTPNQLKGIDLWHILPLKQEQSRTKLQAISGTALYKRLQRIFSNEDNFFIENTSRSQPSHPITSKVKREIYKTLLHFVSFDNIEKTPSQFKEIFDLNLLDSSIKQELFSLFEQAHYLLPQSGRVIFIQGKPIIFRDEVQLVHTDSDRKLTQGEKRRNTIISTFNTFKNIYDAIRSQHHAIDNMQVDQETMLALVEELLCLTNDIKTEWFWSKDEVYKRQIDDIITQLWDVRDYKKLWAVLYNLGQLEYTNKSVDKNRINWAVHKFTDRFDNLSSMIDITAYRDLPALQKLLDNHERALDMLFLQIHFIKDKEYVIREYEKRLWITYSKPKHYQEPIKYIPKTAWIEPFGEFYDTIISYKNHPDFVKDVIPKLQELYASYKSEHKEKLSQL